MMTNEILSFDELRALSGFKNLKRISQWLQDSGVPFLRDRFGRPKVNRYALRKAMGGGNSDTGHKLTDSQEPNWDGI